MSIRIKLRKHDKQSNRTILKDLQTHNLLTSQESDILNHLDQSTKELIKREIRKKKKLPVNKTYNVTTICTVFTLLFTKGI